MFIDSHCHLDFPELAENLDEILQNMQRNQVTHALVVSVNLPNWPGLMSLVQPHANLFASVGVHPDYEDEPPLAVEQLVALARHRKVVGIGETGLDYFRLSGDLEWQRARFRTHIRAAIAADKPLIIHTRAAAQDTLRIMREEQAERVGGVMHCFTESLEVARAAIEMGFYISFSGIVTFKNAVALKEVAKRVPLERMLIETDSPYLSPAPYRGKRNDPSRVIHVAEKIAELRGMSVQAIAQITTENYFNLFKKAGHAVLA